ncbi:unnamed protein product [Durusdinium trenchii]|uniref:Uncharacterized protein n=1 Tax=Durusdinium trenchii TaxID=1381693 RepID=A0ABP0PBQ1_9DINO
MPPSHILFDFMHCYLCNGVASWEVGLLMEKICTGTDITREVLGIAAKEAGWRGTAASGKNRPSYLPALWHERLFGDSLYKGQAHQTAAIVPLLRYYLEEVFRPSTQLPTEVVSSFSRLANCVAFIRYLNNRMEKISEREAKHLDELQRQHQQAFVQAYPDSIKPKHHIRFHLPEQYLKTGIFLSCECLESKHKQYKSGVAQNQRSTCKDFAQFSSSVLQRLLQKNLKLLQDKGLPFWQLMPPIHDASLDDKLAFVTLNLTTSESCYLTSGVVSKTDIVLWQYTAGVVQSWFYDPATGFYLRCLKLDFVRDTTWGTVWKLTDDNEEIVLEVKPQDSTWLLCSRTMEALLLFAGQIAAHVATLTDESRLDELEMSREGCRNLCIHVGLGPHTACIGLLWCSITAAQCQLNGLAGHDITVESMGVKSQVMGFEVLKKLNYYQRFYLRKELKMLESWLPNWSHMVPQLIPEVESVLTEVFEALAMD